MKKVQILRCIICGAVLAILLMAVSAWGQNIFVSGGEEPNSIYEITPDGGQMTFVSGLDAPAGLAFDSAGNLYTANVSTISKITPNGTISTFASGLNNPEAIAFNSAGDMFVSCNDGIIKITPSGTRSTFATSPDDALALVFNLKGNLFAAAGGNIIEIKTNGTTSTFVSGLGGVAGLAFDSADNLYASVLYNIIKFATNGTSKTVATNSYGFQGLTINSEGHPVAVAGTTSIVEIMTNGTAKPLTISLVLPYRLAIQPNPSLQATTKKGTFQLTVTMPSPYYTTIAQASPDLVNWTSIWTNRPSFTFTNSLVASYRFYRALLDTNSY